MLYLGMALPGVAMLFRAVTPKAEEFLVPGAFEISCLIVFYLMMTGTDGRSAGVPFLYQNDALE